MRRLYATPLYWECKRCGADVYLDNNDKPRCDCDWRNSTVTYPLEDGTLELAHAACPWSPKGYEKL